MALPLPTKRQNDGAPGGGANGATGHSHGNSPRSRRLYNVALPFMCPPRAAGSYQHQCVRAMKTGT